MAADAETAIKVLRVLCADVVQKAKSGHPGAPMGMAPMAYALWTKVLKFNPANPFWWNRDRFVLSNGHACALLYTMLHLTGYDNWTMEDLKRFRQIDSKTPGHPENSLPGCGGIEVTTGPLGQGISNAVGLALQQRHLAATFNKPGFPIFDSHIYVFCGDGCLQEGVSGEASSLAGHLRLGNLIVLYDDNHITIDGGTELSFTEDVVKRYEAYGWNTLVVPDGDHNVAAIEAAIEEAKRVTDRPTIIKVRTTIGVDSSLAGTAKVHGAPLGDAEIAKIKQKYGLDPNQTFNVPDSVYQAFNGKEKGRALESAWNELYAAYSQQFPDLAAELRRRFEGHLPAGWKDHLPRWSTSDAPKATRATSQIVINKIAPHIPEMIGGSADLTHSTLTYMECSKDFQFGTYDQRNLRYGVREHGMAAIANGILAFGGGIPFVATFLNFIGYALGAVRLSALSHLGVIYVMTHDSIGLGEDGPTHQPINSLAMIRAMPNILDLRPADGNETSGAWAVAIENRHTPSVLALSRQDLPQLAGSSIEGVARGAYVVREVEGRPDLILAATGSEVHLIVAAAERLAPLKVRAVSVPSFKLYHAQTREYKAQVFPDGVPVMGVECMSSFGWNAIAHATWGLDRFGASGPLKDVLAKFGYTVDNIVEKSREFSEFYRNKHANALWDKPFNCW